MLCCAGSQEKFLSRNLAVQVQGDHMNVLCQGPYHKILVWAPCLLIHITHMPFINKTNRFVI